MRRSTSCPALLAATRGIVWVDVPEWDAEAADVLARVFGLHPLAVHDCEVRNRLPKLHAYPDSLLLVLHAPERGAGRARPPRRARPLIGPRYLVTVHGPVNPAVPLEVALRDTARGPRRASAPAGCGRARRSTSRTRSSRRSPGAWSGSSRTLTERRLGARAPRHGRRVRRPRAVPGRDVPHPARPARRPDDRRADGRDLPARVRAPACRPRGEPAPGRRPDRPVRPHRRRWPARRRTTCRASSSSTGHGPRPR